MRPNLAILTLFCALGLSLLSIPGAITGGPSRTSESPVVTFADADIEAAVRAALKQPSGPLNRRDVATVTELDLHEKRILDLSGLDACTGLTKLNLAANFYVPRPECGTGWSPELDNADLTPIASLVNLEELDLTFNDIGDISALRPLTKLRILNLESNSVQDLKPLEGMSQLKDLKVSVWAEKPNWNSLSKLTALESLSISGYAPGLIDGLAGCQRLKILNVWGLDESDQNITGLGKLKALEELSMRMTGRRNLDGIAGCVNLKKLDISENQLTDLSPLSQLSKLESLILDGNASPDLSPLATCSSLRTLQAQYLRPIWNQNVPNPEPIRIRGLNALGALTHLESLMLGELAPGESLAGVATMSALKSLTCINLTNADLVAIAQAPALETLSCNVLPESDLGLLRDAPHLTFLGVGFSHRLDLRGVAQCQRVTHLSLSANKVGPDLAPLAAMSALKKVTLDWEEGTWDLSGLGQCSAVQTLELAGNSLQRWSGLDACDQIEVVTVPYWYGEIELGAFSGMESLRELTIAGGENLDLAKLVDCPRLESIKLSGYNVQHVDAAAQNLTSLRTLDLSGSSLDATVPTLTTPSGRTILVTLENIRVLAPSEQTGWGSPGYEYDWSQRIGGPPTDSLLLPELPMDVPDTPVEVPSPDLRERLAGALSLDSSELTLRQLARVQTLAGGQVPDLRGLEYCVNLEHLDVSYTDALTDISPVTGLQHLKTINLDNTKVADLSPLATCPALEAVSLGSWTDYTNENAPTNLPSFEPLTRIPQLKRLVLAYSGVSDLSQLAGCRQLESLDLGTNPLITDIAPLASLTKLKKLDLRDCNATDVTPLAQLTDLEELSLSMRPNGGMYIVYESPEGNRFGHSGMTGLDSLSGLSKLRILHLNAVGLSDVDFMRGMPALEEVTLEMNVLKSLAGLGGHPALRKLTLNYIEIASLDELIDLPALEELHVSASASLTDISAVASMPALKRLTISGGVTSYEELHGCTSLEQLDLSGNPGVDLTPLAGLVNLRDLNLDSLGRVDWEDGQRKDGSIQLEDLSPLAGLTQLQSLSISSSHVTDLSPLAGLSQLRSLHCYGGSVEDLAPLASGSCLPSGSNLSLEGNPLSVESKKTHVRALQSRGVDVMY